MQQVKQLILDRQLPAAIALARESLKKNPTFVGMCILLSQAYQQNSEFDKMLASARRVHKLQSQHFSTNVRLIECLIYSGEIREAIQSLDHLHQHLLNNPEKLAKLSELYLHCAQFYKVDITLEEAVKLAPTEPQYRYNLAAAKVALGDFAAAGELLQGVIQQHPQDFDAYYSRSTLQQQTPGNNHIKELENNLRRWRSKPAATITLGYALAKELEDLGEYQRAFKYLEMAAAARRKQMRYKVENDTQTLGQIAKTFSTDLSSRASKSVERPVFILGLPRSGTTLLERMLSSHSEVGSLGEVNSFAFSLMHCIGTNSGKTDLIKRSTTADFNRLAEIYSHATKGYGVDGKRLIDKTPLNFLYLGLIKLAFPHASIIHLKRHPLDSCFAIYKTLFRMGYPFSYSLDDLGQYYIAYHRLMEHWRNTFPGGGFLDIEYATLVNQPEEQARRLVDFCELRWEAKIMDFHAQPSPSATASAAQVRQPVYTSSVGRWKQYTQQLQPLRQQLTVAGIDCA
ncbi:MAG: sulfotransferase [Xanthomonadales bacterium]|nr:sulfotransferase [Xanthomonadales bacterium]